MIRKKRQKKDTNWRLSFNPILRYSAVFCLLIVIVILLGGAVLAFSQMKSTTRASLSSTHSQVSLRVNEAITLLEALADLPEFYDPSIAPIDKVKKLDKMAPTFGYMMICYVDSDIIVYSDGSEPASLASRDYMQRLFSTGKPQVTDSFLAGADGATLNYTVAVPLVGQETNITGCLFCAIYFDDVVGILEEAASINRSNATLLGSKGQIMSSTAGLPYGDPIMSQLEGTTLLGTTANELEEQLLAAQPGGYWNFEKGMLFYSSYQRVENTNWDILCSVSFWSVFSGLLPSLLFVAALTVFLCGGLMVILRRYIAKEMAIVDTLVHSVEDLERKIYQDKNPEDRDFNEIIRLTSTGLSDSLTGVVTRSVFLNQASSLLRDADPNLVSALCFVDMDNLKYINDTHGHGGGDVALKSVGYILREYEKRYDGAVGRYGGDEFVLLLINLESEDELCSVLDELVLRLQGEVKSAGQRIPVQCSVGVALCRPDSDLDQVIADADEALYFVKQNGKGYYKIHKNGEAL
ncbi:MAG: sensor domain-containing diguanylate cyclase [Clostridiales Family XIII bacterium]|nr:GGDEF domain-containing protein [Clostridia bacterium]MDY3011885.1 sensor domain-containing diguanylate cyclase [Clostridiales Family XIII bacterium]